jgi:polynucleotide 5'-kinase involved in rRNA processing
MIPDANGKIRIDKNPNNNQSTFESLREDLSEDLEDIYDHEKNLAKNLELIFNESIFLPWKDVQMPIFLAYSLIPSALSTVCPIMFLHGERGSGKSTATILLSGLHQQKIMSAATTFAALRNHFQRV